MPPNFFFKLKKKNCGWISKLGLFRSPLIELKVLAQREAFLSLGFCSKNHFFVAVIGFSGLFLPKSLYSTQLSVQTPRHELVEVCFKFSIQVFEGLKKISHNFFFFHTKKKNCGWKFTLSVFYLIKKNEFKVLVRRETLLSVVFCIQIPCGAYIKGNMQVVS